MLYNIKHKFSRRHEWPSGLSWGEGDENDPSYDWARPMVPPHLDAETFSNMGRIYIPNDPGGFVEPSNISTKRESEAFRARQEALSEHFAQRFSAKSVFWMRSGDLAWTINE